MGASMMDEPEIGVAQAVKTSLQRETDTDWFPDPWLWVDVDQMVEPVGSDQPEEDIEYALVPFLGGRKRKVPVLGHNIRHWLMNATLQVMTAHDPILLSGVFSYRLMADGSYEHYREANYRRTKLEVALGTTNEYVVTADINSFFRSVTVEQLASVLGDAPGWRGLSRVVTWLEERIGYALPEGHSASRSLANAALAPADLVVEGRFTRWVDDYHVFCESRSNAERTLGELSEALGDLGFTTSRTKTGVTLWDDFRSSILNISAITDEPQTEYTFPVHAIEDSSVDLTDLDLERRLRHALRKSAENGTVDILDLLSNVSPSRIPVSVMPRLGWALASSDWSSSCIRVFDNLVGLDDEFLIWRRARLLPALWSAPRSVALPRLDQVMSEPIGSRYLALILLRLAARHDPTRLNELEGLFAGPSWSRGCALARRECRGRTNTIPGPPMKSYL